MTIYLFVMENIGSSTSTFTNMFTMLVSGTWMYRSIESNLQSFPVQVYLILDEFILAGELQETSKKVCMS